MDRIAGSGIALVTMLLLLAGVSFGAALWVRTIL
jgi:hypothetical protein